MLETISNVLNPSYLTVTNDKIHDEHKIKRIGGLASALCQSPLPSNQLLGNQLREQYLTIPVMEQCKASAAYRLQYFITRLIEVKTHNETEKKDLIQKLSGIFLDPRSYGAQGEDFIKFHFHAYVDQAKLNVSRGVLPTFFAQSRLENFLDKNTNLIERTKYEYTAVASPKDRVDGSSQQIAPQDKGDGSNQKIQKIESGSDTEVKERRTPSLSRGSSDSDD